MNALRRYLDPFMLALLLTIALAFVLPVQGFGAEILGILATAAVVILFFLHGLRLPRQALFAAVQHWRLHLLILSITYLLMPAIGLGFATLFPSLLPLSLWTGVLFLCALPSTVQSAIAFTLIGRGNVAGAVASAAASNLLGVVLTPLLIGLLAHNTGGAGPSFAGIWKIVLQLLLPFAIGHLCRPYLADWAARNKQFMAYTDRGTIVLAVYSAFSAAVIGGIWQQIPLERMVVVLALCAGLLAFVLTLTAWLARALGYSREDEVTIVFCGSHKSLASGVPMARVLFAGPEVGFVILPVMIFHQLQLMASVWLARRYAQSDQEKQN
ncbi:MAG: bile acid:sodium symporter family protein [Steroidobacteraceae bacterium]